mgnify:CR=1 FL=1
MDYQIGKVSSVTTNTFTFTCADTGGTSGSDAVYGTLFTATVTQSGGNITALSIVSPGGLNGSSQLNNLTVYSKTQNDDYDVTVPTGLNEGAGGYNSKTSINLITIEAKAFDGVGNSGNLSISTSYQLGSNFNVIGLSGVGNFSEVMYTIRF